MFFVFEGLDGSGSTTQAKLLAENLAKKRMETLHTSEPTDNRIGKMIRQALQKEWTTSPEGFQLLFSADRALHLQEVIEPALREGKIVICDRYVWSTIAYGSLRCDVDWLTEMNRYFLRPDFTFFLDVPVDVCLERISKRGSEKEFFEEQEKLQKVSATFHSLVDTDNNALLLDGMKTIDEIAEQVLGIVAEKFSL